MVDVLTHLAAGTIAGMTGVLVDYPLDTIKTRMQVRCSSSPTSYLRCAARLYEQGGVNAFYRGLSVPFAAQGAEAAIIFSVYNTALHHFRDGSSSSSSHAGGGGGEGDAARRSVWSSSCYWKASACAGLAVSLVLTPVELLKCNLQMESNRPLWQRRHVTVRGLAAELYAHGGLCGLYRGMTGTMTRAVFGNVAYFLSYEQCKQWLQSLSAAPSQATLNGSSGGGGAGASATEPFVPAWQSMLAGGISGCLYWSIAYPADVVKTQMQVCTRAGAAGFRCTFRHFYRSGGVRALYRGWGVTAVRAFVSSAVVFTTYERCSRAIADMGPVSLSISSEALVA